MDDVKTEYSQDDLPLDPEYADVMRDWKKRCPTTEREWVFLNPTTEMPYWQETVAMKRIKPAATRAKIGNVGWHTFRHTYRTWLDSAGAPISIQRELMRHASIQTGDECLWSGDDVGRKAASEQQCSENGTSASRNGPKTTIEPSGSMIFTLLHPDWVEAISRK